MKNVTHQEPNKKNHHFQLLGILSIATAALTAIQVTIEMLIFVSNIKMGLMIMPPQFILLLSIILGIPGVALTAAIGLAIGVTSLLKSDNNEESSATHNEHSFMKTTVAVSAVAILADVVGFMMLFIGVLTNPVLLAINAAALAATTAAFLCSSNYSPRLFSAPVDNADKEMESTSLEYGV